MADYHKLANILAGDEPLTQEYTTADILARVQQPSFWERHIKPWSSTELAKAEPNWFGRNILANPDLASALVASMFVGPVAARNLASAGKPAMQNALGKAQELAKQGANREAIWNETGWFQGRDGKWRFEMDDSQAHSKVPASGQAHGAFRQLFKHPELYEAYPEMKSGRTLTGMLLNDKRVIEGGFGEYTNKPARLGDPGSQGLGAPEHIHAGGRTQKELDPIVIHELQHAVGAPNRENFSPRTTAEHWSQFPLLPGAYRRYFESLTEIESRLAQKRFQMTPEERKARPPWLDYDVPE